jgi:hypothetical protein
MYSNPKSRADVSKTPELTGLCDVSIEKTMHKIICSQLRNSRRREELLVVSRSGDAKTRDNYLHGLEGFDHHVS